MQLSYKQHILFLAILCGIVLFVSHDDILATPSPGITHVQASSESTPVVQKGKYEYIEITNSCDPYFNGLCIPVYVGPGTQYQEVQDLRNGMVLKIKETVKVNGQMWYRVHFDEWLRYPERVETAWYVPAVAGRVVTDDGARSLSSAKPVTSKRIIVDLSDHMLYAYDGNVHFMTTKVSTGVEFTPTPMGTFTVFKKMPSRYMQGPLPGVNDNAFDLPGVPWNLYFTEGGAVIHGSYWHDRYGTEQSSGCINLPPELAKILFDWADLGTVVVIRN